MTFRCVTWQECAVEPARLVRDVQPCIRARVAVLQLHRLGCRMVQRLTEQTVCVAH